MTNENDLSRARLILFEALLDRRKGISKGESDPTTRGIQMLNFMDGKVKDAIRIIDGLIQSSSTTPKRDE